jgi:hypothetical protein
MDDFTFVSAAWMLEQKVTTYDAAGNIVPDDGEYQRRGAELVYVFAEFLARKGLLVAGVDVTRRPDRSLRFSELTAPGQRFARFALDKWLGGFARAPDRRIDETGLERYWTKFLASEA